MMPSTVYTDSMPKAPQSRTREVGIRELREHLSKWIAEVQEGKELTVTDRGKPVARISPVDEDRLRIQRLVDEGIITPAQRPRRPASEIPTIPFKGDIVPFVRWARGYEN
jgi:prevent-host-death family protein